MPTDQLLGQLGGNAVYASVGARLAGAPTEIVSRYGTDVPDGLLADLTAAGVSLSALRAYDGPTTRSWLIYGPDGQRRFVPRSTGPALRAADLPLLHGSPVLLVCALPLPVAASRVSAIRADAPSATIVLDSQRVGATSSTQCWPWPVRWTSSHPARSSWRR